MLRAALQPTMPLVRHSLALMLLAGCLATSWPTAQATTQAMTHAQLPAAVCPQEVRQVLSKWHSLDRWRKFAPHMPGTTLSRSPTTTIGQWVEILAIGGRELELRRISAHEQEQVSFNDQCQATRRLNTHPRRSGPVDKRLTPLTDDYLSKLVKSGKKGVVYLWSPYMQISVQALKEAKAASAQQHIMFLPAILHADQIDDAIAAAGRADLTAKDLFLLDSAELNFRKIDLHFPSLVLFGNKRILERVYRGAEDHTTYKKYFADYLRNEKYN